MRAYIQTNKKGEFFNINAFNANEGFLELSWETCKFQDVSEITDNSPEVLIVGGIGSVRKRLEILGLSHKRQVIDYPDELEAYFGRRIWRATFQEIVQNEKNWNIFIKPRDETKKFVGRVVREYKDLIGLVNPNETVNLWCSEVVNFITEWRCFVRYQKILDVRYYKGAWDSRLDLRVVENAVANFKNAPAAYGMDFGIDENGAMKLVEVNDGHSLGGYGISAINYAKFLSARWAELTDTEDYLNF